MARGFDVAFCRVLWVSLVVVAVSFTVILTGLFVDIDGLIKHSLQPAKQQDLTEFQNSKPVRFEDFQNLPSAEDEGEDNADSGFRTKRSLESSDKLIYQIKSPKMKKIITNHLATLLEELDQEESLQENKKEDNFKTEHVLSEKTDSTEDIKRTKEPENDNYRSNMNDDEVLHKEMHNILLQGITGHMDLNDVYKKVHLLVKSLESRRRNNSKEMKEKILKGSSRELMKIITKDSYNEEAIFFEELLKCQKLHKQISQRKQMKNFEKNETTEDPSILIKTIIEINNNEKKNNLTNPRKNIKGLIKLLYNGQPIKIEGFDENKSEQDTIQQTHSNIVGNKNQFKNINTNLGTERSNRQNPHLDNVIAEYLKESFESKRLKRQIKIHYKDREATTKKAKVLNNPHKKHEDELYVEIETHFDGKGVKGERKKKLVRSLIDKIQKAINSNFDGSESDNKEKPLQIKKRTQNPIDHEKIQLTDTTLPPLEPVVEHRLLNPISKTVNVIQPITSVLDKHGDTWKRDYIGPGFLSVSKSINSAEKNEMDIDYNSVLKNGIPKRLLKPINSESEDLIKPNEDINVGNVTLYLKEIDGSGFTIGINQYTDEPPDKESLQMFTGLENLIKSYHQSYDQPSISDESKEDNNNVWQSKHKEDAMRKKRSVKSVKLISSIKPKTKINKYLNTKAMQTRKIFLKTKRNKRHVDKIRIVASDHYPRHSKEDIFLLSRENIFADRAILKDEDTREVQIGGRDEEHYDFIGPYENPYSMNTPHLHSYIANVYDTKALQTGLMAHYPHIFLENVAKSNEVIINSPSNDSEGRDIIKTSKFRKSLSEAMPDEINDDGLKILNNNNTSMPNVDDIVKAILPPRTNYKLTVKILPKNKTDDAPGYKEVHTLINKTYDKNGLRYVSTVNVSEISKFESLNKIKTENLSADTTENDEVKKERNQMKLLLNLHKVGIDLQLEHLRRESEKLKQMIDKEDKNNVIKNMSNIVDIFKHLALKELEGKIISEKVTSNNSSPIINETIKVSPKNKLPEPEVSQSPIAAKRQEEPYKTEILKTIKQNENITIEILHKIDKNTDILQTFLQKLSDRLDHVDVKTEKISTKDTTKLPVATQFLEDLRRNYSNAPIPFFYAFQPPMPQNKNSELKDVANIVYHGHIHTKDTDYNGKRRDLAKKLKKHKEDSIVTNETKFFIDDLENDYKLASNVNHNPIILVNNSTTT